ncbi:PIG-L family deacetylase [Actinokineospora globicatena]|uniref:PIG-L family deacetylase n=1 Tax=Actinokineospora globicatena TaxID=103729 RepID=UPI0020A28FB1|nr:PIG-L family deacetylase [Actinokineospora globicatena]MCP2300857.1 N-acetylglucosaminyl deacetylase, LmbE family [Actinokineospora globicatena]GLW77518.1 GlcNAc-PI de-N-acetylase [Actinokineospora globicatena]GLW84352.1 GlcNAc-PI de-N-acetylase [Actinokineospora globicatena]
MATLVTFHAHPDDECINCGGVMRKAADEGHRVVLVVATRGELGEVEDGFLAPGEDLTTRRVAETHAAAEILGVSRVEFLGYTDSGMMGEPSNDTPGTFWTASVDEAAERLAKILVEESADVLTTYDDNGGYGHPDHIQVHRVGRRAAELAGTARVYQATANRDDVRKHMGAAAAADAEAAAAQGIEAPESFGPPEEWEIGKPLEELTARVDVRAYVAAKRAAMRAHASQISEESFFLSMPDPVFAEAFGVEWFIREGAGPGITETDIMAGL